MMWDANDGRVDTHQFLAASARRRLASVIITTAIMVVFALLSQWLRA